MIYYFRSPVLLPCTSKMNSLTCSHTHKHTYTLICKRIMTCHQITMFESLRGSGADYSYILGKKYLNWTPPLCQTLCQGLSYFSKWYLPRPSKIYCPADIVLGTCYMPGNGPNSSPLPSIPLSDREQQPYPALEQLTPRHGEMDVAWP